MHFLIRLSTKFILCVHRHACVAMYKSFVDTKLGRYSEPALPGSNVYSVLYKPSYRLKNEDHETTDIFKN